jgi:hypothetical protein
MKFLKKIESNDAVSDELGTLLDQFGKQEKWNKSKYEMFESILDKALSLGYLTFSGDRRTYALQKMGEFRIFNVSKNQRGALAGFAGIRVRMICAGARDQQSGRYYLVGPLSDQTDGNEVELPEVKNIDLDVCLWEGDLEAWIKRNPPLYLGKRMAVIDNRKRLVANEDNDLIVFDRMLRCIVAWGTFEADGSLSVSAAYGPHEIDIDGENAKELAMNTTKVVNWTLRN